MTPHPTLIGRHYAGASDLPALAGLWPTCRPLAWQTDFPTPTDLAELLALPEVAACTQVWEDAAGRVLAYALVDGYDNLWFDRAPEAAPAATPSQPSHVRPSASGNLPSPVSSLIAWGITCARERAAASGGRAILDTACRAEDDGRIALLRAHGFAEQEVRTLRLVRSLAEPIPEPVLPAGYAIRPVAGAAELAALVALHRAAFGTEHMTAEERLAWMAAADYDPGLDLVIVAPSGAGANSSAGGDGELAAYCFCAIHTEENRLSGRREGFTDPVATHPNHQRRGLARALLSAGMALLRARGAETAVLGTSSDNCAMLAAAQAVGYRVASERVWFSWRDSEEK